MKQNGDFITKEEYKKKKKKIPALAGAKGRHKNMFSAVMSTAERQLVRVKENEAKENEPKLQISVGFAPLLGSLPRDYFGFFIRILSWRPCTVLQ